MGWEQTTPEVATRNELHFGPITLDVSPASSSVYGKFWQHICISLGEFSKEEEEYCLRAWPRQALELARQALDEFEDQLDEEKLSETSTD